MKCRQARVKISAWQDGELRPETRQDLLAHLEKCPDCRQEKKELSLLFKNMPKIEPISPSTDFFPSIQRKIARGKTFRESFLGGFEPARSMAMAMAAILLLTVSYATGIKIAGEPAPLVTAPQSIEDIYHSVLNLSVLDLLPGESLGERYNELFNGEETI